MTAVVMLVIVGCLVGGVVMFLYAVHRQASSAGTRSCRRCRRRNPSYARFCGQCGAPLV
ncbi:MAG: zinc-ribbon domain-containing protein [Phycisphaerales bacterium]|nr:MAG: zinc-ribbon domain-containing protein [Phycisphaerales bacterium]